MPVKIVSSILQFWLLDSRCFLCVCCMCLCAYVHKHSCTHLTFNIPCNSAFPHSLQFFYHKPESVILTSTVYAWVAAVLLKGMLFFKRYIGNCRTILTYNHAIVSECM